MSYRTLDATEIVKTPRTLEQRIAQRFPESGLSKVCHELVGIGEDAQRRAEAIATPNIALRITIYVAIVAGNSASPWPRGSIGQRHERRLPNLRQH